MISTVTMKIERNIMDYLIARNAWALTGHCWEVRAANTTVHCTPTVQY